MFGSTVDAVQDSTRQLMTVLCSAVQGSAAQYHAVQCSAVQCSQGQCRSVLCSAAQGSAVQSGVEGSNPLGLKCDIRKGYVG